MSEQHTLGFEVIIVGLGPTGLVLANTLGQLGISVLVLEREPHFYGNARAVYTDGECMRIFQSLGLADRLLADMIEDVPIQVMTSDRKVLLTMKNADRPYGWALSNFFYQPLLETQLAEGLARYPNVIVRRGREMVAFEQDEEGVTVRHAATQGADYGRSVSNELREEEIARGAYLIGADGGRSKVRSELGIGMQGSSYPNPWLVLDIKAKQGMDGLRHLPYFSFVCDPDCPTVNCVQPQGHHRFEFMLGPGQTKEQMEHPDTVRHYLSKWVDVDQFDVLRKLVYTFNALVAERWRDRRVLLAGDAAHMTPQFVGQGMNSGVRDAHNLGWKLAAILRGQAEDTLLDSYEPERRPHVSAMIREAVRMKDFVSIADPRKAAMRDAIARIVLGTPWLGDHIKRGKHMPQAIMKRGSYVGLPRRRIAGLEGRLAPQPTVRGSDGCMHRLDDLLGHHFAVVGTGVDPRPLVPASLRAWCDQAGLRFVAIYPWGGRPFGAVDSRWPADLVEVEDVSGEWHSRLKRGGQLHGSVVVLRPDKFVFGAAPASQLAALLQELRERLHSAPLRTAPGRSKLQPSPSHKRSEDFA